MNPIVRWLLAAFLAPVVAIGLLFLLPSSGGNSSASITGMGNIAYAVNLVLYIVVFAVLYGIVFPLVLPRLAVSPLPSLIFGVVVASLLLWRLGIQFDVFSGEHDEYALKAWKFAFVGMLLNILFVFYGGLWNNRFLSNLMYWRRIFDSFKT